MLQYFFSLIFRVFIFAHDATNTRGKNIARVYSLYYSRLSRLEVSRAPRTLTRER